MGNQGPQAEAGGTKPAWKMDKSEPSRSDERTREGTEGGSATAGLEFLVRNLNLTIFAEPQPANDLLFAGRQPEGLRLRF